MNHLVIAQNINYILVFLEGMLSFLSPCILPLLPIYIGYLAGSGKTVKEDGTICYQRKKVFTHTIWFVLGVSCTFFLLGMSFSALGDFLKEYKTVFSTIAGILILFMGFVQLGVIKIKFLETEKKMNFKIAGKVMNPGLAFLMGFTFSFAWTPCIGPALASVLSLASSSTNLVLGNLLVLLYTIGFIIPFLLVGFFTTQVLNFLKEKQKIVQYTIKVSGAILIIMGILTLTGLTGSISGYLGSITNQNQITEKGTENDKKAEDNEETNQQNVDLSQLKIATDFTLKDQYGKEHKLSDYKGKVVFLNFWATWCPPCKEELPAIEEIYQEFHQNQEDVIILGMVNPKTANSQTAIDQKNEEEIKEFLRQSKVTYPVLFDQTGDEFYEYGIQAFPTTFMINQEGKIFGYVQGALKKEQMRQIINQTKENKMEEIR